MSNIIKNFSSLLIARIITLFLSFIGVAYLARVLEPALFGQLNFTMAIIAYLAIATDPGLTTVGVREIAQHKKSVKTYIATILPMRAIFTFLVFGFFVIFIIIVKLPSETKKLGFLFGLTLFPPIFFLDWVYKGLERMCLIGVAGIIRSFVYVGSILLLIKNPTDIWKVPLIMLVASTVMTFPLWIDFNKINKQKEYNHLILDNNLSSIDVWPRYFSKKRLMLFKTALPIFLSSIAIAIYTRADMVMLGFMRTAEEVGFYAAAYKVQFLFLGFYGLLVNILYPVVARLITDSKSSSKTKLILLGKYSFILGVLNLMIVFFGANFIIKLIFGTAYLSSILPLKILIWQLLFAYINIIPALCLLSIQAKDYSIGSWIGAIMNVLLNFLLIPMYGINGAAFATAFSECIIFVYMFFKVKRYFNGIIKLREFLMSILIAFIAIVPIIFLVRTDFLKVILAPTVFVMLLFLFGIIKKKEVMSILHDEV